MAGHRPSVVSTGFLKSRFLETAQTSVYMVKVQPTSSVIAFLSQGSRGVNYNSQDGINIELLCRETTLPGQTLATADQPNDYPGVSEKMVYRKIYDDRTDFTFYVDKRYKVVEFFEGWIDYCAGQGTTYGREDYRTRSAYYRMNYPNAYKTDGLYITKFEKDAKNSMSYQFIGAFPISIAATPVSYDQSDVLKCTVSFSYMRYLRRRSGAGSERTGFMQRDLRAEKSWYTTPDYRSYKTVNSGPVSPVKNTSEYTTREYISDTLGIHEDIVSDDYVDKLDKFRDNEDPDKLWNGINIKWSDWINILGSGGYLSF